MVHTIRKQLVSVSLTVSPRTTTHPPAPRQDTPRHDGIAHRLKPSDWLRSRWNDRVRRAAIQNRPAIGNCNCLFGACFLRVCFRNLEGGLEQAETFRRHYRQRFAKDSYVRWRLLLSGLPVLSNVTAILRSERLSGVEPRQLLLYTIDFFASIFPLLVPLILISRERIDFGHFDDWRFFLSRSVFFSLFPVVEDSTWCFAVAIRNGQTEILFLIFLLAFVRFWTTHRLRKYSSGRRKTNPYPESFISCGDSCEGARPVRNWRYAPHPSHLSSCIKNGESWVSLPRFFQHLCEGASRVSCGELIRN